MNESERPFAVRIQTAVPTSTLHHAYIPSPQVSGTGSANHNEEVDSCNTLTSDVKVDARSSLTFCDVSSGNINGSILLDVNAVSVEAEGAILVNVTAGGRIVAPAGR